MRVDLQTDAVLLAHWLVDEHLVFHDFAGEGASSQVLAALLVFYQVEGRPIIVKSLSLLLLCGKFNILDF